ncbi:hypothetical protein BJ875DRAFT_513873 [Amylocarpus encephaloides]|uniref:Uncharacterized protein n=1 Tax=Amylocarpus encephaloides TaxID=45428 RepID=A0A9P8C568_9HELO|nr:hypothetical protein BJ875DRAFT_513873 [Amylocarpus encephaloides]
MMLLVAGATYSQIVESVIGCLVVFKVICRVERSCPLYNVVAPTRIHSHHQSLLTSLNQPSINFIPNQLQTTQLSFIMRTAQFLLLGSLGAILAAPVANPEPAPLAEANDYGSYQNYPASYNNYPLPAAPTPTPVSYKSYGKYSNYGTYKREADPEMSKGREAIPEAAPAAEANPEMIEGREAAPEPVAVPKDYGNYGKYGTYNNHPPPPPPPPAPTSYGTYSDYGSYKREAGPLVEREAAPEAAPAAAPEKKRDEYQNYGTYGTYNNYPAAPLPPPAPVPTGYGTYSEYGAYKREAEAAPVEE